MYPCLKQINISVLLPIIVVSLSSLCAFCITEYTNSLQISMLNVTSIPQSYRILFKISSTIAAIIPIVIFLFLFFSAEIMLNDFFGEKIRKQTLLNLIGISFIPMLLYQYLFWFNILSYCHATNIKEVHDFINMTFIYGLTFKDFEFINLLCWILIYLIPVIYFIIYKKINMVSTIISFLLPSSLVILFYYIIIK